MIHKISSMLLRMILYEAPKFEYSEDEIQEFNRIYDTAITGNSDIHYESDFPKYKFIQYISETKNVLLHGSNHNNIEQFEPRKQTLYNGEITEAVFATQDGIWPVFYAILNRSKVSKNFRNGSIGHAKSNRNYHFYSLDNVSDVRDCWLSGTIYFLENESFTSPSKSVINFNEWTSLVPVKPITKLTVNPSDFYFIDQVAIHNHKESIIRTYVLYKFRLRNSKRVST